MQTVPIPESFLETCGRRGDNSSSLTHSQSEAAKGVAGQDLLARIEKGGPLMRNASGPVLIVVDVSVATPRALCVVVQATERRQEH